jgi:hypothetical protein
MGVLDGLDMLALLTHIIFEIVVRRQGGSSEGLNQLPTIELEVRKTMLRTFWYDAVDPFRELTSLQQWMDQTLQQTLN